MVFWRPPKSDQKTFQKHVNFWRWYVHALQRTRAVVVCCNQNLIELLCGRCPAHGHKLIMSKRSFCQSAWCIFQVFLPASEEAHQPLVHNSITSDAHDITFLEIGGCPCPTEDGIIFGWLDLARAWAQDAFGSAFAFACAITRVMLRHSHCRLTKQRCPCQNST